ncbi:golgin subfamily A member 7-like [Pecten maximus]|uniref:golgin subfamily A member 7-like n=1 Tax=Pecten maximus TaxID=6579 RepID=UPI001457ED48|nr:golgin subfamily A member 7-like [Pecten maximus]XP_033756086.1 golgin subfamily A member 7-like [Pecten maximus]
MTQNHKMDDLSRVMTANCAKTFVQRDFSDGTSIKFLTKFPPELDGKIESEQFVRTVTQLNSMFLEAESLGSRNYCESCLACLTAYMSYICFDTHYEKMLKKIKKFVEEQNQTIYLPRGLLLVDPVERGLRVLEICVLNESNGRG